MNETLTRISRFSLVIGAIALIGAVVGAFTNPAAFFTAYLSAFIFTFGLAIGSMALFMLHNLVGGTWGIIIRRICMSGFYMIALSALLFIPIAAGMRHIFPWARAEDVAIEPLLQHRRPLFNPSFVIARAAIYFALWLFGAWQLRRVWIRYDRTPDRYTLRALQKFSAAGLLVLFVTTSLAAFDWIASREIHWYSSTFGLMVIIGFSLSGLAFAILMLALLRNAPPPDAVHDLGNLLLTLVILWSYIAFAQFLIIWIGNMREDVTWYAHRVFGGWKLVGVILLLFHFAVPFVLLLMQPIKRQVNVLARIAGGLIVLRALDVIWMVAPSSSTDQAGQMSWIDPLAIIGVFGLWFAAYLWVLQRQPLERANLNVTEHGNDEPTIRPIV